VIGGLNLTMQEVSEAAKVVTGSADPNAAIIWGTVIDESLKDEVRITVVATGFDAGRLPSPSSEQVFGERQGYRPPKHFGKISELVGKATGSASASTRDAGKRSDRALTNDTEDTAPAMAHASTTESDGLEIPAFIRRKLG
ncbi:hypothetical protein HY480_02175, partial [Candidatus Uhrbacteria bacterium]|nr:hypothetical protein [Candidatus Uhrbacteria bacterium]